MFVKGNEVKAVDMAPGIMRKVLTYNEDIMVCEITLKKDSILAEHSHMNLQNTYIAQGKLKLIVEGKEYILTAGDSILMEGDVIHSGVALEDTKAIDTFAPMRKDFL